MQKDASVFIIPFSTASVNHVMIIIFPTSILLYIAFDKQQVEFWLFCRLKVARSYASNWGQTLNMIRFQHSNLPLMAASAVKFLPSTFLSRGNLALE